MATVNISRQDRDNTGQWVGRTALGTNEELFSALRAAKRELDPTRMYSVETVLSWDTVSPLTPTPTQPVDYVPAADYQSLSEGEEGFQWKPTPPPEPFHTPPIPLDLLIPVESNAAPVPQLAPWWDQLRINELPPPGTISGFGGEQLAAGPARGTFSWHKGADHDAGAWSYLYAAHDRLTAAVNLQSSERKINGPGAIGSLIPIYSEMKEAASAVTERKHNVAAGCTLPYKNIHAITGYISYQLNAPKLSSRHTKDLAARRGHGPCEHYYLRVETSDGWRPYSISLEGGHLDTDVDTSFLEFATWLGSMIVYDRLHQPWITDQDRATLTSMMTSKPTITERVNPGSILGTKSFTMRQTIPGFIPISAQLT